MHERLWRYFPHPLTSSISSALPPRTHNTQHTTHNTQKTQEEDNNSKQKKKVNKKKKNKKKDFFLSIFFSWLNKDREYFFVFFYFP